MHRNTRPSRLGTLADGCTYSPFTRQGRGFIWLKGETDISRARLEEVESFGEFAKRNNAVASTDVKSFEHLVCTEQPLSRRLGFKVGRGADSCSACPKPSTAVLARWTTATFESTPRA